MSSSHPSFAPFHILTLFLFPSGIGDGGNELGMGRVKEAVKKYIRNGDVIACDVEADFAIIAGEYLCAKKSLAAQGEWPGQVLITLQIPERNKEEGWFAFRTQLLALLFLGL